MITETGWTHDQVNETAFPDVLELIGHWNEQPTANMILRSYFGIKPKKRKPEVDRKLLTAVGQTKHIDCAKPHIQAAIDRLKKGKSNAGR